eukprot:s1539_g12.t1
MSHTQVWDIDEEKLLRHFCLEDECKEVLSWFEEKGYKRPEVFSERVALSKSLREASNERVKEADIREAMMLALCSLHCLDFNKGQSVLHSEDEKTEASDAILPLLSNLSYIFLKRNDSHNSVRAATLGLTYCDRKPGAPAPMRAKLLFRRGLGRCQAKDFEDASADFIGAARIMPDDREIRNALEECKAAARKQSSDSHSKWRGTMTTGTDKLKASARRFCKRARRQMREAMAGMAEPLLFLAIVLLAPLIAGAVNFLLRRDTTVRGPFGSEGAEMHFGPVDIARPGDRAAMNTSTLRGTLLDLECFLPVEHSSSVCAFGFEGKTSEEECDILCTALMAALSLPSAYHASSRHGCCASCARCCDPRLGIEGVRPMGRGKPRREKPEAPVGGPELADSDVEEADIEALARSKLRAGEFILGEEPKPTQDESAEVQDTAKRGVCLAPLLLQRLSEIEYKVPEGAKRVPWIDTMAIDGQNNLPKGVTAKDGVKLESAFLGMAAEAAAEGYRRLRVMKIPCTRPNDFYAEMMRPDKQMYRVRQQAAEEERRIKIVEDRKKQQASKKFAKKAKAKKLEARAQEKRTSLEEIANWRARKKSEGNNKDDQDLEEILSRQGKKRDQDGQGKGKGKAMKSAKRRNLDEKYGFGGKKKRSKQNDKSSTHDMSASPWGRGRGKGGKGKGRGKGKGKGSGKKRR